LRDPEGSRVQASGRYLGYAVPYSHEVWPMLKSRADGKNKANCKKLVKYNYTTPPPPYGTQH